MRKLNIVENKILLILIILFVSALILLYNSYYDLGVFYFYFIIIYLVYDIISKKNIQLIHVWNGAFLYIILSEVFKIDAISSNLGLETLKFLTIANNVINIGYLSKSKVIFSRKKRILIKRNNNLLDAFLIFIVALYFIYSYESAIKSFTLGRNIVLGTDTNNFIIDQLMDSLGLVLPAILAYYYLFIKKQSLVTPLLLSLPIFIIIFLYGTRNPLLFSFLGFVLTASGNYIHVKPIKKYIIFSLSGLMLLTASLIMREVRSSVSKQQMNYSEEKVEYKDVPSYFSQYMSPEGIIDMNNLMFQHFKHNEYLYGANTSFIFYFWVPRSIWSEKPTMLGHWLIRLYRGGFGSIHSSSFGFAGELYADFGYYSMILIMLLGRLLKYAEDFKDWTLSSRSYAVVIGSMLFPYVFFFVRSPITSTITFLGIIFVYLVFGRFFEKKL